MTSSAPLDIKTIYSAAAPRKRRSTIGPKSHGKLHALRWSLLGLMNISVMAGLYYGTWWPIDKFLYMTAMLHTPLPGIELDAASNLFGPFDPTPRGSTSAPKSQPPAPQPAYSAAAVTTVIGSTWFGWLALSTLSYSLLGLAGGVTLGQAGLRRWRRLWLRLAAVLVIGLLVGAGIVLAQYGTHYPSNHTRIGMAGVALLPVVLGLGLGAGARKFNRIAGFAVVIAAVGTVTGWYLLGTCDALDPRYASIPFIATVFLGHGAYGALLALPIASRMSR